MMQLPKAQNIDRDALPSLPAIKLINDGVGSNLSVRRALKGLPPSILNRELNYQNIVKNIR